MRLKLIVEVVGIVAESDDRPFQLLGIQEVTEQGVFENDSALAVVALDDAGAAEVEGLTLGSSPAVQVGIEWYVGQQNGKRLDESHVVLQVDHGDEDDSTVKTDKEVAVFVNRHRAKLFNQNTLNLFLHLLLRHRACPFMPTPVAGKSRTIAVSQEPANSGIRVPCGNVATVARLDDCTLEVKTITSPAAPLTIGVVLANAPRASSLGSLVAFTFQPVCKVVAVCPQFS